MDFSDKRRQQFLGERQYLNALESFEEVVYGADGLVDNLRKDDDPPGWHKIWPTALRPSASTCS